MSVMHLNAPQLTRVNNPDQPTTQADARRCGALPGDCLVKRKNTLSNPLAVLAMLMGLTLCASASAASAGTAGVAVDVSRVDTDRGEALYENHCRECHDQRAFTREQRLAGNYQQLEAWVTAWSVHAGLGWDIQTIRDVTAYLNQRFYGYHD